MSEKINLDKIFKACGFLEVDKTLEEDLCKILDWQKKISDIDTEGIEPMFNTIEKDEKYICNQDIEKETNDDVLSNAPEKEDDFFLVPKIIKNNL